ncbi:MAG: hypothetical protein EPO39_08890 [Candidatus Manganitrophaceae bacterium]|nr:MAG: hypothetical protein EPO39_08890 [Candidatus Manganitrophaceae bacterium]
MAGLLGLFFFNDGVWQLVSFGGAGAGLASLFRKAVDAAPSDSVSAESLSALLNTLLQRLSGQFHSLLKEIRSDLLQMQSLLQDTSEKLARCFSMLDQQDRVHRPLVAGLKGMEMKPNVSEIMTRVMKEGAQINQITHDDAEMQSSVNRAVLLLQFEDLAAQLMARMIDRVQGAETTLQTLHRAALEWNALFQGNGAMLPDERRCRIMAAIKQIESVVDALEKRPEVKSVLQQDMNPGSVELF